MEAILSSENWSIKQITIYLKKDKNVEGGVWTHALSE